jgi:hypothetical protein
MSTSHRDKREDLYAQFPSLKASPHAITSEDDDEYNCVGWVRRETDKWYEPGFYWPQGVPEPTDDRDVQCYIALFERWGYVLCANADHEPGFLKIAIYAHDDSFQHVAKQLRGGGWSSKAGTLHDLRHESLEALCPSGIMRDARPIIFMRTADDGDPQELERTGLVGVERT